MTNESLFINVDLELESHGLLAQLLVELDSRVVVLHTKLQGARYQTSLELSAEQPDADSGILALCELVEGLFAAGRAAWDGCSARYVC